MAVWGGYDKNSPDCESGDGGRRMGGRGGGGGGKGEGEILAGDNSWQENGFSELEISAIDESQVEEFEMFTAYPNPFNGITTFSYQLLDRKSISLEIYNISGRLIQRLIPGKGNSVRGELIWDAMNLPSGIYYAKLAIDGKNSGLGALKLLLLR
ncbi:T9SS type A sorting domain-containing protein [bacterium]|nr:T9SS type A sorting domain-containing protein [bacterium]